MKLIVGPGKRSLFSVGALRPKRPCNTETYDAVPVVSCAPPAEGRTQVGGLPVLGERP